MPDNRDERNLEYKRETVWRSMSGARQEAAYRFSKEYIQYLNTAKTEREAVRVMAAEAAAHGFVDFQEVIDGKIPLQPGLKVYWINRGKAMIAAVIGKNDPALGCNMVGAHIDAPRLDFRPNPLYEDHDLALVKTHYYGGIKKYQWVSIPLAIHGVIAKKDGSVLTVSIGEQEDDPVFVINDLLPHLAYDQIAKKADEVISGENLNLLVGSVPEPAEDAADQKRVKYHVLKILNDRYGITERDFNFAELEIVPALQAKFVGLDRGLIGGYAQDDRVCAYTAFRALLDMEAVPDRTVACYFSDKEEIGSVGNTGARSNWLENFFIELCNAYFIAGHCTSDVIVAAKRSMASTKFLSADVTAAYDPTFSEVSEPMNAAYCGMGIAFEKYTGHKGKSGASEASCEMMAEIAALLDRESIPWQLTELGKIDKGGGGTIAQFMADIGMDVIDCGVPVLGMHSPYEVTSTADVYWTYRAYHTFLQSF